MASQNFNATDFKSMTEILAFLAVTVTTVSTLVAEGRLTELWLKMFLTYNKGTSKAIPNFTNRDFNESFNFTLNIGHYCRSKKLAQNIYELKL